MTRADVVEVIYQSMRSINELRGADERLACSESTVLYGIGGGLDSLNLVSLLMDVETAVNDQTGAGLVLADEHAMAQRRSPFRDVQSLADHVMDRLQRSPTCPNPA